MSVQEIEEAIVHLSVKDVAALTEWLTECRDRLWDKQIDEDTASGRLDEILAEVDHEYQAVLVRLL